MTKNIKKEYEVLKDETFVFIENIYDELTKDSVFYIKNNLDLIQNPESNSLELKSYKSILTIIYRKLKEQISVISPIFDYILEFEILAKDLENLLIISNDLISISILRKYEKLKQLSNLIFQEYDEIYK